jgi:ATP-dependent Clp protease ATP-binding subunit ClpA
MFERFTDKARRVVVHAQEIARERGADAIRTEHLLLGLYAVPDTVALTVLSAHGVTRADVEADVDRLRGAGAAPSDAEALATLGIDLEEVRRQVEEAFGPGALDRTRAAQNRDGRKTGWIRFDPMSKKSLQLALREALALKHDYIGTEHLLLGLIHTDGGAAHHILVGRGVHLGPSRVIVEELVRAKRAG